jgi:hypothetical protein
MVPASIAPPSQNAIRKHRSNEFEPFDWLRMKALVFAFITSILKPLNGSQACPSVHATDKARRSFVKRRRRAVPGT